jgi:hypothetical protein
MFNLELLQALDQGIIGDDDLDIPGLGSSFPALPQHILDEPERRSTPVIPPGFSLPPYSQSPPVSHSPQTNAQMNPGYMPVSVTPSATMVIKTPSLSDDRKVAIPKMVTVKSKPGVKIKSKPETDSSNESPTKRVTVKPSKVVEASASPVVAKKLPKKQALDQSKDLQEAKSQETSGVLAASISEEKTQEHVAQGNTDAVQNPSTTYAKSVGKKPIPGTLTLTTSSPSNDTSIETMASRISRPPSATPSITSRPQTPSIEALNTPIKRTAQPRTLRITETPRTSTPPIVPIPDFVPQTVTAGSKVSSRRPSLTSSIQPSTPMSEAIDMSSLPSASKDVSRANSPPPLMSKKRGDKKPKKSKRVQTEPDVLEAEVLKLSEEQSPIMGRKKKSKKPEAGPTVLPKRKDSERSIPASPIPQSEQYVTAEISLPAPEPFIPLPEEPIPSPKKESHPDPSQSKTKRLAENLFAALGPELDKFLNSSLTKPISMQSHLRSLDFYPGSNQRPFSHPSDLDAFIAAQDPFVLSPADYAARTGGQAIRKSAEDGRLSSRIIETPRGTRLRCLSEQEEDLLIELEDKICSVIGTGFWGGGSLEYAIAGMPGYDRKQKQQAIDTLGKLFPREEQSRSDVIHSVGSNEDPARLINQFVFTQETEAITPMVPYAGEKAHVQQQQRDQAAAVPTAAEYARQQEAAASRQQEGDQRSRSMADSAADAASAAARAALAIGNTRDVIQQAMGEVSGTLYTSVEDAERSWQEERRHAEGLERRLNGVVKRNRKVLTGFT